MGGRDQRGEKWLGDKQPGDQTPWLAQVLTDECCGRQAFIPTIGSSFGWDAK